MSDPNPAATIAETAHSPFAELTPRMLFGVQSPAAPRGPGAEYRMIAGPWTRRADGSFSAASLGMLLDYAFTTPGNTHGKGMSNVTTELSFDLVPGADPVGDIVAVGSHVGSNPRTSLSHGRILDSTGALIGVGSAAIQFVPVPPPSGRRPERAQQPPVPLPVDDILGMRIIRDEGGATGELTTPPWHSNSMRNLHGGIVTALLEHNGLEAVGGDPWQTASLRVLFLRPGPVGGPIRVVSTIDHRGRSFAAVRGQILREDGKLVATASTTYRRAG